MKETLGKYQHRQRSYQYTTGSSDMNDKAILFHDMNSWRASCMGYKDHPVTLREIGSRKITRFFVRRDRNNYTLYSSYRKVFPMTKHSM